MNAARDRAHSVMARLAGAELDDASFRHEAAAILRRAVGFEGWSWLAVDPGARLPTSEVGEHMVVDRAVRRFLRMMPETWDGTRKRTRQCPLPHTSPGAAPAVALSTETGGDLSRDPCWRDVFGPAGVGDKMGVQFIAGGTCWGLMHLHRDSSSPHFSEEDTQLVSGVAPLLAARLRARLRDPGPRAGPGPAPVPEPGTIMLDGDLSLVAATDQAWQWISRLGLRPPNDAEPLPSAIYVLVLHLAMSPERPPGPARIRLQATDGRWAVARAAPLSSGSGAAAGYAVTLEAAPPADLAPLLMRAWGLTARERDVARLAMDGLSTEDIAASLYISGHTVRGHLKTIFARTGVSRRQDLVAVLGGGPP